MVKIVLIPNWLQGLAMGLLTHFWNEWEWQQVLPAFHFSSHTPWLNGKCWTKTAAMLLGYLVGCVQHFSVSHRISSLFICHALYLWFFSSHLHFPLFFSPYQPWIFLSFLYSCFSLSFLIHFFVILYIGLHQLLYIYYVKLIWDCVEIAPYLLYSVLYSILIL